MCRYTKFIDPAYAVMRSAIRFWNFWARSSACFMSAGLGAGGVMRPLLNFASLRPCVSCYTSWAAKVQGSHPRSSTELGGLLWHRAVLLVGFVRAPARPIATPLRQAVPPHAARLCTGELLGLRLGRLPAFLFKPLLADWIPGLDPVLAPDILGHALQGGRDRECEQSTREPDQPCTDQRADDDGRRREVYSVLHDPRHEPVVLELLVENEVCEHDQAQNRGLDEGDHHGGRRAEVGPDLWDQVSDPGPQTQGYCERHSRDQQGDHREDGAHPRRRQVPAYIAADLLGRAVQHPLPLLPPIGCEQQCGGAAHGRERQREVDRQDRHGRELEDAATDSSGHPDDRAEGRGHLRRDVCDELLHGGCDVMLPEVPADPVASLGEIRGVVRDLVGQRGDLPDEGWAD